MCLSPKVKSSSVTIYLTPSTLTNCSSPFPQEPYDFTHMWDMKLDAFTLKYYLKQQENGWEKDYSTYCQQRCPHSGINLTSPHWNPCIDVFTKWVRIDICLRLIFLAIIMAHKPIQQIIYNKKLSRESIIILSTSKFSLSVDYLW